MQKKKIGDRSQTSFYYYVEHHHIKQQVLLLQHYYSTVMLEMVFHNSLIPRNKRTKLKNFRSKVYLKKYQSNKNTQQQLVD